MSFPEMYFDDDDEVCPDYNVAVSRSNTATTTSSSGSGSSGGGSGSSSSVHWRSPFDDPPPLRSVASHTQLRCTPSGSRPTATPTPPFRIKPSERYIYSYNMDAAGTLLTFFISVEPSTGRPSPGKYTFRLSLKVNDVERPIGEPASLLLGVDPRTLEFAVFVFPGKKNVLPAGGLYSLRVWLRVGGIDHRVFGEDDLWLGKDLDFHAVADASFARLRSVTHDTQVYDAVVGRAKVQFIVRWKHVSARLYKYSMEYEAGGVGATLIDDLRLILDSDPRRVTFLIYSIPIPSMPRGASHHLRVWLKSFVPPVPEDSPVFNDSYVYQRLWKSDTFKIGGRLDFEALGPKLIMGVSGGRPQTVAVEVEARLQRIRELPLVGYQPDSKVYNG